MRRRCLAGQVQGRGLPLGTCCWLPPTGTSIVFDMSLTYILVALVAVLLNNVLVERLSPHTRITAGAPPPLPARRGHRHYTPALGSQLSRAPRPALPLSVEWAPLPVGFCVRR